MNLLSDTQRRLLTEIGREKSISGRFYLTGGTALAVFYLEHRYSEDLDFFSETEFSVEGITTFFEKIRKPVGFQKIDLEQNLNRNIFFLEFPNEAVKMEFTFFPFPRVEASHQEMGVQIDSLLDIAVNKLFSIYQRSKARDYIDLYFICRKQKWTVGELVKKAKIKFDWHIDLLQLGSQFIKAETAKDYPRMAREISDDEWRGFFVAEARRLKDQIIEA